MTKSFLRTGVNTIRVSKKMTTAPIPSVYVGSFFGKSLSKIIFFKECLSLFVILEIWYYKNQDLSIALLQSGIITLLYKKAPYGNLLPSRRPLILPIPFQFNKYKKTTPFSQGKRPDWQSIVNIPAGRQPAIIKI